MLKPRRSIINDSLPNVTKIPIAIQIIKQPVAIKYDDDDFYDAPDHFSDDDEFDDDDEQAPEDDISEMVIQFHPLTVWNNSEHNEVEYVLPPNFGEWRRLCFNRLRCKNLFCVF